MVSLVLSLVLSSLSLLLASFLVPIIGYYSTLIWKHMLGMRIYQRIGEKGLVERSRLQVYLFCFWIGIFAFPVFGLILWYGIKYDTSSFIYIIFAIAIIGKTSDYFHSSFIARNLSIFSSNDILKKSLWPVHPTTIWYLPISIRKVQTEVIKILKEKAST